MTRPGLVFLLVCVPLLLFSRPEHEMGSAPRPDVNFPEYAASRGQIVRVLCQRFFSGVVPEFGRTLGLDLLRSQSTLVQRLGWLHQSLLSAADSLSLSFMPQARPGEIVSAADYAREFLGACRAAGIAARLVVPYDPASLRLTGVPGVAVRQEAGDGDGDLLFFPASRVFPEDRVPWYLDGKTCLLIAADGTFREERLAADMAGSTWTRIRATVRRDGRQTLQYVQQCGGLDAAIARAGALEAGPVAVRLFLGREVGFWSVRHLWQLGEPFSCEAALAGTQEAGFAARLLDIRLKKRFDGFRPGDWQDEIFWQLPVGTRIGALPAPLALSRGPVSASLRWRVIRGQALVRPAHWGQAVWQRWLANNDPRTPDTLVRERRLTLKGRFLSPAADDDVEDAVDALVDGRMPDVVLPSGGR